MLALISSLRRSGNRRVLQAFVLMSLGILFLIGAALLRLNPFTLPVGLFLFGLGLLAAAMVNPAHLTIAGIFFTLIGAAIFLAYKPLIHFDDGLVVIAIGLALLGISLAARRGYVSVGAWTPGIFVLLVGLLLYGPSGGSLSRLLAPFLLSLWFPGAALLVLGVIYWFMSATRYNSAKKDTASSLMRNQVR